MIGDFLEFLTGGIFDFLNGLLGIFPRAEIDADVLEQFTGAGITGEVLSWVNYFLPLDIAAAIVALWATGMIAYLGIKMALRYTGEIL